METCLAVLCNLLVYSTELSQEFLERRSFLGIVLPAAAHNPGDFHGAGVRGRHTVPWNKQTNTLNGSGNNLKLQDKIAIKASGYTRAYIYIWLET